MPESNNMIKYLVVCVGEFADRFGLTIKAAYEFLSSYGGISFLIEHYEIEHTLSFDDALDDLEIICQKNGGALV